MRAALAAYPDRLANQIIITGQSQGSGSSIGASRIAESYAPELKLRATIATGVVSSFPQGPYQLPSLVSGRSSPARFTMLRLVGGSLPDGGPAAETVASDAGQSLLQLARTACVDEMRGHEQQQRLDLGTAFRPEPDKLSALLLPATDMTLVRLPAPVFLGTGLADRTVPPQRQYAAAVALCAAANPVVWKSYAGITHNGIVHAAFDDELAFVRRVIAGQAPESNCGSLVEPGQPGAATAGIRFND